MTFADWLREVREEFGQYPTVNVAKHAVHTFYLGGLRYVQRLLNRGTPHWDGDWDVLVICDACRVDLLKEVCEMEKFEWLPKADEVDSIRSSGSTSDEWMDGMFCEEYFAEMRQTAYVSGNLFIQGHPYEEFAAYAEVPPEDMGEIYTVDPKQITERAVSIWRHRDELDVDRMIVHYFQPHTPFRSRPEWFDRERENRTDWGEGFARLRDGELDAEEFREAYLDNVVWTMESVNELRRNVADADIVVSADHGNGLGEYGVYGHPAEMPIDAVRRVPWMRLTGTDEGTISTEPPDAYLTHTTSQRNVEDHLEALGYR